MKHVMMTVLVGTALVGCAAQRNALFAAHDQTVEYVRVFDIKTAAPALDVARAASAGISRNIRNPTLATPLAATPAVLEQPGRFALGEASASTSGSAAGPNCDGASWTAKARPDVRGSADTHIVACLYPYKAGYHLDLYAAITRKQGGWLGWPRRALDAVLGTPDRYAEKTMLDVVRTIREQTNAQVALVEARPDVVGAPWLEPSQRAQP